MFLFAAGKCFLDAQSRHYQDPLRLLCEDLNASADAVLEIVRAGSELGLAVLESGAPAKNPTYTRHLSKLALELLAQPDVLGREEGGVGVAERLAVVYRDSASTLYHEALQTRVGQADLARTLGAWPLLTRLADRGVPWAEELADRYWPGDVEDRRRIVLAESDWPSSVWLRKKVYELIPRISPSAAGSLMDESVRSEGGTKEVEASQPAPTWCRAVYAPPFDLRSEFPVLPGLLGENPVSIGLMCMFDNNQTVNRSRFAGLRTMPSGSPVGYRFVRHIGYSIILGRRPSPRPFAPVWTAGTSSKDTNREYAWKTLPWPLGACLAMAQSQQELADLAMRAEQGQLGDASEWRAAEERWAEYGVTISELTAVPAPGSPFDASIATAGFPIIAIGSWSMTIRHYTSSELRSLLKVIETDRSTQLRGRMFWVLWRATCARHTGKGLHPARAIVGGWVKRILFTCN